MENRHQPKIDILQITWDILASVSTSALENTLTNTTTIAKIVCMPLALCGIPYLYNKMKKYDYTIHGSFRRIMETGNFSSENSQIIENYLSKGHDPDIRFGIYRKTPLMSAVEHNNFFLVNFLLNRPTNKANVNIADQSGKTPLHFAFEPLLLPKNHAKFNSKIAEKLLEGNAKPNILIGNNRETPLTLSLKYSKYNLTNLILKNHADIINTNNLLGETPLSIVIDNILQKKNDQEANYILLKNLLNKGADPNVTIGKNGEVVLIEAIKQKNMRLVNSLLQNNATNINIRNKYRETAFSTIINNILDGDTSEDNYTILTNLLAHGVNINAGVGRQYGEPALILAVIKEDLKLVNFLLENDVDVNFTYNERFIFGKTEKITAAVTVIEKILNSKQPKPHDLNYIILEKLFQYGAKKDFTIDILKNPLIEAIKKQNIVLINLLLHHNIGSVNNPDEYGYTPLSTAIEFALGNRNSKSFNIVKKLLDYKADPNIKIGKREKTPLILAVESDSLEIVKLLLQYKQTDVRAPDQNGKTPFYLAYKALKFNREIVKCLLENSADPNIKLDESNHTPLINAFINKDFEMVNLLLKWDADINASDLWDNNVLSYAVSAGNLEIVKYLLQKGAIVNPEKGQQSLTSALINQNLNMIKLLLKYGANVNPPLYKWETSPLAIAIGNSVTSEHDNFDTVKLLCNAGASLITIKKPNSAFHVAIVSAYGIPTTKKQLKKCIETLLTYAHCKDETTTKGIELLLSLKQFYLPQELYLANLKALYIKTYLPDLQELYNKLYLSTALQEEYNNLYTFDTLKELYNNIDVLKHFSLSNQAIVLKKLCKNSPVLKNFNLLAFKLMSTDQTLDNFIEQAFENFLQQKFDNFVQQKFRDFVKELRRELVVMNYKDPILTQVHKRITELKKILKHERLIQDNQTRTTSSQTALQLLQVDYSYDQTYIQEITPLLDGTKLDADFKELVEALTKISKSDTNNLKEFLSLLDSTLNNPDNLALQMYKNCALPED